MPAPLSLLEKGVPWRLQGPEATGLLRVSDYALGGLLAQGLASPREPPAPGRAGAQCPRGLSHGDQEGEHPSRRLRASRRPTCGGASLAACTLPVVCSDHSHLLACAYTLSCESRTSKHTLHYKPWEREDFLPREVPERTLQVAFLYFNARG